MAVLKELTDAQFADLTKLVKIISESIKAHMELEPSSGDVSLYAMQVLSVICSLNRGYTKTQIEQMWAMSNKLSSKLHAASKGDTGGKFQSAAVNCRWKN